MGGEDDDAPIAVDLRQDWIAEKVCETLKIKKDKFDNMEEESLFPLKDFMDKADVTELFVSLGDRDSCVVTLEPGTGYKKKSCYFIKLDQQKMPNNAEEIASLITHGDFSKSPLEQLSHMAHEVFLPMLLDPAKQYVASSNCTGCAPKVRKLCRTLN